MGVEKFFVLERLGIVGFLGCFLGSDWCFFLCFRLVWGTFNVVWREVATWLA